MGLNGNPLPPPKDMSMSSPPEPVNMTLFGKRVFADAIKFKDVEMWSSWIIQFGPKSSDKGPKETEKEKT